MLIFQSNNEHKWYWKITAARVMYSITNCLVSNDDKVSDTANMSMACHLCS